MDEPDSSRPAAAFSATLELTRPTLVEITAGALVYPHALQRASTTVLLIPGHDLTNDGIVLHLYGYLVQVDTPNRRTLIAKEDVMLRASVRTLSGALVRPHSDWDSRKMHIYAELLIGDRIVERLQMFYGEKSRFEAPFLFRYRKMPRTASRCVIAADVATGNFGVVSAQYPVLSGTPET